MLELRQSVQKESINQRGRFQKAPVAVEVHVKDEKRFAATRGWAFFEFHGDATEVAMTPAEKECYSCHQDHGTLDTTFGKNGTATLSTVPTKPTIDATAFDPATCETNVPGLYVAGNNVIPTPIA